MCTFLNFIDYVFSYHHCFSFIRHSFVCLCADNPEFVASTNVIDSSLERTLFSELLIEDLSARCLWKLSLDDENNAILREEFFYEQVMTLLKHFFERLAIPDKLNSIKERD